MKQSKSKIKGIIEAKKKSQYDKPKTTKYKGINFINFEKNGKKNIDILIIQDEFDTEKKARDYGNKLGYRMLRNKRINYPDGSVREFNTFDNSTADIKNTLKEIFDETKGKYFSVLSVKNGKLIDHHHSKSSVIHSLGMKHKYKTGKKLN